MSIAKNVDFSKSNENSINIKTLLSMDGTVGSGDLPICHWKLGHKITKASEYCLSLLFLPLRRGVGTRGAKEQLPYQYIWIIAVKTHFCPTNTSGFYQSALPIFETFLHPCYVQRTSSCFVFNVVRHRIEVTSRLAEIFFHHQTLEIGLDIGSFNKYTGKFFESLWLPTSCVHIRSV